MLRVLVNAVNTNAQHNIVTNSVCVTSVRWRRKPRWFPVAKSKLFRVPERRKQDEDEKRELMRLHNNYKTQMRSVLAYLREEVVRNTKTSSADHLVVTPEEEALELQKCDEMNRAWNAICAEKRDARLKLESEQRAVLIAERLEAKIYRDQEILEKIEDRVRLEKQRAKTFITEENLDQAIEFALANPVDVNFAIDLKQNIYRGRTGHLPEGAEEDKVAAVSSGSS